MTEKNQTVTECRSKHSRLWWAIGLVTTGLLGLVATVIMAAQKPEQTNTKVEAEIQRSTAVDDAQGDVLKQIQTDVREVRTGVAEINEFLRNGKGE